MLENRGWENDLRHESMRMKECSCLDEGWDWVYL